MIIVHMYKLILSCLNRINKFALLRIRCFGIFGIRLTETEAIDVWTHCKVLSYVLFVACNIIKNENRIRKRLTWRNDVTVIGKCKVINFFYQCQ